MAQLGSEGRSVPPPSVVMVFLTYVMQVESWRRILAGWGQRLAFGPAARTWSVANLGRYVPGKVWSVAGWWSWPARGRRAGPGSGVRFVIQAVSLGSGVAVVAAVTPTAHRPSAWRSRPRGRRYDPGARLASHRPVAGPRGERPGPPGALALSAVFAGTILRCSAGVRTERRCGCSPEGCSPTLRSRSPRLSVRSLWATFSASWPCSPPAGSASASSCWSGYCAVPRSGGAVAVSVASRVLLTLTEAAAALLTLPLRHRPQESVQ